MNFPGYSEAARRLARAMMENEPPFLTAQKMAQEGTFPSGITKADSLDITTHAKKLTAVGQGCTLAAAMRQILTR